MKPTPEQLAGIRNMARQFPEFVEFVAAWQKTELDALPFAKDNLGVMQGRVQTLTEMQRVLKS